MKPYLTIIAAIFLSFAGYAQEQDFADEYIRFKEEAWGEFIRFRREANQEYAQFLKQAWKEMDALQAVPYPHHDPPVFRMTFRTMFLRVRQSRMIICRQMTSCRSIFSGKNAASESALMKE